MAPSTEEKKKPVNEAEVDDFLKFIKHSKCNVVEQLMLAIEEVFGKLETNMVRENEPKMDKSTVQLCAPSFELNN